MNRILCLSIAAVFLFGAAVVHGQDVGTLVYIDCSSVQAISFAIDIPDIAEWYTFNAADVDAWALNGKTDASCKPSFNQATGYVEYAAFRVVDCADAPTVTNYKVEYWFQIDVLAAADPTASPVTYQYDHQYTVTCTYDRELQNLMASFEPKHLLFDDGSAGGNLMFELTLHNYFDDSPFYGVIDLGTPFYVQVLLEDDATFPDLDVHLLSVTASQDASGVVTPVTLITNGCEEQTGIVEVDSLTCDTNADERFDMIAYGAFRYPGQVTGDLVYFHAVVTVCLSANAASICQTQCLAACPPPPSSRKRRETVQDAIQTTYYVKTGPYRIVDPNEESAGDKDEGAGFPSYAIAVVAVCVVVAIVAIASAVVVIVLRKGRQNATVAPAERRDAYVTA